ncbi:hypothetical protein SA2016_0905 [Sinomonas atrocyanea]|uniref:Uncharacterized protein n=1 Tax=Sinomonas atrocyanea TaxID=37927 RepID=A0A126ZWX0_9MICC|nr:hypothetical protein [Sinomonas atrocyanea]AMM31593.1 hypothetical protein SA2016_0905 [Sinomonas atrocyanea]GEB64268.1 hypothetical protein SAT01_17160 [Sinomonas atrocyanea]GGG57756.1 hypothetical protein GCM10007172_05770 [Sinomonas atrocyanea]
MSALSLIVLDDEGQFRLYAAEAELLRSQERPGSTRCVIDRTGQYYHLQADPHGRLVLGRPLGPAEHHSLRQHLLRQQHLHPEAHRLRRRHCPTSREEFLEAIFEELALEGPGDDQPWTVRAGRQSWRCNGLRAVDAQVARASGPVVVTDPFGHAYRPRVPWNRALARRLRGHPLYVEILPEGAYA